MVLYNNNSNNMFLSILIPVYRVEKYIERCATSLFEQTLQDDIEFIFVDDCGGDGSINVLMNTLNKYPKRKTQVLLLRHLKNRGLAAARQTALEKAAGDYVLTVDSDDWLELDACEKLQKIALQTNADIVRAKIKGINKIQNKYTVICYGAVGAYPYSDKYINELKMANSIDKPLFYLRGGIDYSKLGRFSKLLVQMVGKTMKDIDEKTQIMFKQGYDFVIEENLEKMIQYIQTNSNNI